MHFVIGSPCCLCCSLTSHSSSILPDCGVVDLVMLFSINESCLVNEWARQRKRKMYSIGTCPWLWFTSLIVLTCCHFPGSTMRFRWKQPPTSSNDGGRQTNVLIRKGVSSLVNGYGHMQQTTYILGRIKIQRYKTLKVGLTSIVMPIFVPPI